MSSTPDAVVFLMTQVAGAILGACVGLGAVMFILRRYGSPELPLYRATVPVGLFAALTGATTLLVLALLLYPEYAERSARPSIVEGSYTL